MRAENPGPVRRGEARGRAEKPFFIANDPVKAAGDQVFARMKPGVRIGVPLRRSQSRGVLDGRRPVNFLPDILDERSPGSDVQGLAAEAYSQDREERPGFEEPAEGRILGSAQQMENGRGLEVVPDGIRDDGEKIRLFPIDGGRDVRAAEKDDSVRSPEYLRVFGGAGVFAEQGVPGKRRGYLVEAEPAELAVPDIAPGFGVVRRFPPVINADDDEPGDVEEAAVPERGHRFDRRDRGIEDSQADFPVRGGRRVEETLRLSGDQEYRNRPKDQERRENRSFQGWMAHAFLPRANATGAFAGRNR